MSRALYLLSTCVKRRKERMMPEKWAEQRSKYFFVRVEPEFKEEIEKLALENERTVSAQLRWMLNQYLNQQRSVKGG